MFETSRAVLAAKRKQLKSQGLGNKPNRAECLTDSNVETLWESGQIGMDNASALTNMLWFLNTELLGLHGSHESRQMCWGDFEKKELTTDGGFETVIEWTERVSKCRQDIERVVRDFTPTIYPIYEEPEKCPVRAFNLYESQRAASMLDP